VSEEKLAEIAPYFATETYQPGRDLVRQNEPGDKFYIIARARWRSGGRGAFRPGHAHGVLQEGILWKSL